MHSNDVDGRKKISVDPEQEQSDPDWYFCSDLSVPTLRFFTVALFEISIIWCVKRLGLCYLTSYTHGIILSRRLCFNGRFVSFVLLLQKTHMDSVRE